MQEELTRRDRASILNLFQKMTSNVTRFKDSICSSPSESTVRYRNSDRKCPCAKQAKQRKLEGDFYSSQLMLVNKTASILEAEGEATLAKLLQFVSEYLGKLVEEMSQDLVCACMREKISQHDQLVHKIHFLREQNHKFFKIIEEKNQECEALKHQLQQLKQRQPTVSSCQNSAEVQSQDMSSRAISSNSSRVSEFKVWPELVAPQATHKKYFEPSPGDREAHTNNYGPLLEKNQNQPICSAFPKPKLLNLMRRE